MDDTIYLWLKQSESVKNAAVNIGTVARVFCSNRNLAQQVKQIPVYEFTEGGTNSIAVSVLLLVSLIEAKYPECSIELLGDDSCVVYRKSPTKKQNILAVFYFVLIAAVAFFGAAFSIMSFNTDTDTYNLLVSVHEMFIGVKPVENSVGMIAYSLGLLFGMMLFFNHGLFGKKNKEPTPLQVQMRLYERDVNDAVALDAARKGEMQDVD